MATLAEAIASGRKFKHHYYEPEGPWICMDAIRKNLCAATSSRTWFQDVINVLLSDQWVIDAAPPREFWISMDDRGAENRKLVTTVDPMDANFIHVREVV